jgi:hypothetical protein
LSESCQLIDLAIALPTLTPRKVIPTERFAIALSFELI